MTRNVGFSTIRVSSPLKGEDVSKMTVAFTRTYSNGGDTFLMTQTGSRRRVHSAAQLRSGTLAGRMYVGPEIDDPEILERLPPEYRLLLERVNGYIAYHGGLHLRGACLRPEWHSLRFAWYGDAAIHRLFPQVLSGDVPFAEDALGDQFVVRGSVVWKLNAENGDIVSLDLTLAEFDAAARANPGDFLALAPLDEFRADGGELEPGQLLGAYPPFVFKDSAQGVRLRAVPSLERRLFLAELAHQVGGVPDGAVVQLVAKP